MIKKISVVINTFNEEKNIQRAIKSVSWADEILICDMYSEDKTAKIAKNMGAKVVYHKREDYVEPARNFAISQAAHKWILILDADEEIPKTLAERIKQLTSKPITANFVLIPRKNIIFDRWMQESMWWPDYHIRLFKKGSVVWDNKIHSKPETKGVSLQLPEEEKLAIVHHNYQTVGQFIDRMNRYSRVQAEQLQAQGYKFDWKDLISKPLNEFLSRFFDDRGYKDGLHGLALSLLQAFSFLVVYLKVWEMSKFKEENINLSELEDEKNKAARVINYWMKQSQLSANLFKRFLQKIKG